AFHELNRSNYSLSSGLVKSSDGVDHLFRNSEICICTQPPEAQLWIPASIHNMNPAVQVDIVSNSGSECWLPSGHEGSSYPRSALLNAGGNELGRVALKVHFSYSEEERAQSERWFEKKGRGGRAGGSGGGGSIQTTTCDELEGWLPRKPSNPALNLRGRAGGASGFED
ncbi:hypothetical protein M407DRAFT_12767, partial [Tulasnella calospora MUT 4182]